MPTGLIIGCAHPPDSPCIPIAVMPLGGGLCPVRTTGANALRCFMLNILFVEAVTEKSPGVPAVRLQWLGMDDGRAGDWDGKAVCA